MYNIYYINNLLSTQIYYLCDAKKYRAWYEVRN